MLGEVVQRLPYLRTDTNGHGREKFVLGDPVRVVALAFAPEQSNEPRDEGGSRVVTPATLYLPYSQETDPRDAWVVRGRRYVADGEAAQWRSPFTGRTPGQVVALRRVLG